MKVFLKKPVLFIFLIGFITSCTLMRHSHDSGFSKVKYNPHYKSQKKKYGVYENSVTASTNNKDYSSTSGSKSKKTHKKSKPPKKASSEVKNLPKAKSSSAQSTSVEIKDEKKEKPEKIQLTPEQKEQEKARKKAEWQKAETERKAKLERDKIARKAAYEKQVAEAKAAREQAKRDAPRLKAERKAELVRQKAENKRKRLEYKRNKPQRVAAARAARIKAKQDLRKAKQERIKARKERKRLRIKLRLERKRKRREKRRRPKKKKEKKQRTPKDKPQLDPICTPWAVGPYISKDKNKLSGAPGGYKKSYKDTGHTSVGIIVERRFNCNLSFSSGLMFASKGSFNGTFGNQSYNFSGNYIDIPALAQYHFMKSRLSFYGGGGLVFNINSGRSTYRQSSGGESYSVTLKPTSLNMSFMAKVGIEYQLGEKSLLFVESAFKTGLTPIVRQSVFSMSSNPSITGTGIAIGLKFNF